MKRNQKIRALVFTIVVASPLAACHQNPSTYKKIEPAHLEHIEGSDICRMTLTERAAERLGIQTALVTEEFVEHSAAVLRKVIPYSSTIYDAYGHTWVYTNPEKLVYVRHEVIIDFIEGNKVLLLEGPPTGATVVTVGVAELYGTEYEVGH